MSALRVLVTEPVMGRFTDVLTRDGASPHTWTFDFTAAADPAEYDVLVCSSATPELLAAMPRLRLVHVTGAGVDKIPPLPSGVQLANTFHHGRSIAEHVMMTAMMLLRRVLRSEADLRRGVWQNAMVDQEYPFGGVLAGRTLGVVGFGEIGATVARLGAAMGMTIRTVRRRPEAPLPAGLDVAWVGRDDQLHELLAASDVVVVTVPLSDATRGLIDAAALASMKPTAILINVARGAVVDEQALYDALETGTIAGAGIDVWWRNPREPGNPPPSHLDFTELSNVVLTPHQSGHTAEVFAGRAVDITDNVDALADGRPLRNLVDL
ncbi:phosphoglycerate dehydrogenase-like enzyme [Kribbella amoyensis]|uniref:Phosphoglycerate dehydrogenase-like enzyme n=1 Tax=Kribbella amoyensis TaxID=996641 RepID=A0A561B7F5_9ACTN|nr:2-hydroxyacid dehydrogenase [Kribbella amoyensis]TWD74739.1 phosphoglycerate dehydrogenase-like enzyme [Kribbella amoyensis]